MHDFLVRLLRNGTWLKEYYDTFHRIPLNRLGLGGEVVGEES